MTTPTITSSPAPSSSPDGAGVDHAPRGERPGDAATPDAVLPILAEVPLLGTAIDLVRTIDRSVAQLLDVLIELEDHDVAEHTTGVALEQWLAIAGRRTSSDRRMLLTACDVLRRLPSLRIAFCQEGAVSWAQTRAVALAVHRLPRALDDTIDGELSRTIDACRDADPDTLTSAVSRAARSWDPAPTREVQEAADREEFVALQPRLDGSGGKLFGDLGPLSFATVDAALSPPLRPDRTDQAQDAAVGEDRGADGSDADGAGAHGHGADGHGADGHDAVGQGAGRLADHAGADPDGAADGGRLRPGRHRARRLVELCDASLSAGDGTGASVAGAAGSRPQLLLRMELDSLLDRDAMPAELLTRLTGGKLWLDAATARRLVDERGADLRAVVLDDRGRVVGVGRRSRIATDWLVDATLALHDTCTYPGCVMPARRCQTDHARPWHPTGPAELPGRTDIDQLAPLCEHHNGTKEAGGWRASQSADGSRRWEHQRSGLTTITRPATWRPKVDERGTSESSPAEAPGPLRERRAPYLARERPPPYVARERPPPYLARERPLPYAARAGPPPMPSVARERPPPYRARAGPPPARLARECPPPAPVVRARPRSCSTGGRPSLDHPRPPRLPHRRRGGPLVGDADLSRHGWSQHRARRRVRLRPMGAVDGCC